MDLEEVVFHEARKRSLCLRKLSCSDYIDESVFLNFSNRGAQQQQQQQGRWFQGNSGWRVDSTSGEEEEEEGEGVSLLAEFNGVRMVFPILQEGGREEVEEEGGGVGELVGEKRLLSSGGGMIQEEEEEEEERDIGLICHTIPCQTHHSHSTSADSVLDVDKHPQHFPPPTPPPPQQQQSPYNIVATAATESHDTTSVAEQDSNGDKLRVEPKSDQVHDLKRKPEIRPRKKIKSTSTFPRVADSSSNVDAQFDSNSYASSSSAAPKKTTSAETGMEFVKSPIHTPSPTATHKPIPAPRRIISLGTKAASPGAEVGMVSMAIGRQHRSSSEDNLLDAVAKEASSVGVAQWNGAGSQ